ncbi:MAG TPA: dihydrofolate reductase family protein [Candidatus Nanopelagicales bacterium]
MGRIHVDLFATMDGVAQAPGGPEEDLEGGFRFGGWQAPLLDEVGGGWVDANLAGTDALLLGRRTYDIFAAYWPHQSGGPEDSIAGLFNRIPKYVASRNRALPLPWQHATRVGDDLAAQVRALRDRHAHVHVIGSVTLFQSLLAERLFDELTLWVHPVVLGQGKRVFDPGTAARLRLLEPAATSPAGVVQLRYALIEGEPETGDMTLAPDADAP